MEEVRPSPPPSSGSASTDSASKEQRRKSESSDERADDWKVHTKKQKQRRSALESNASTSNSSLPSSSSSSGPRRPVAHHQSAAPPQRANVLDNSGHSHNHNSNSASKDGFSSTASVSSYRPAASNPLSAAAPLHPQQQQEDPAGFAREGSPATGGARDAAAANAVRDSSKDATGSHLNAADKKTFSPAPPPTVNAWTRRPAVVQIRLI